MSKERTPGGGRLLEHLAVTYLRARWYMGVGLVALAAVVVSTDIAGVETWAVAVAGGVILAHAFAMSIWNMDDPLVALLIDITAATLAAMIISTMNGEHTPIVLTFVGASILIGLFTERWSRVGILAYVAGLTMATLLLVENWNVLAATGHFIGGAFVSGIVIGVISAIRTRLIEVEAARAQTIGVVSHELRNHLTGVVGAIELVTGDDSKLEPGEGNELLQLGLQQAVEAEEVIEDLLIASRAERGVLDAVTEPVDLCPLTETVIRRTSVESSDIVYDFSHGPVVAMADPLRYKQIIRNLLTNAQRYGGDTVRVSIEEIKDVVSVAVADNGEGIDPADVSSLFQAYRGGGASQGVPGSSGLGLWIARSLAQKMDGQLVYERRSGQTVFELTLPAAPRETPEPAELEPSLSSSRS